MPRLLLLRHAKAERAHRGGELDHERQLSEGGKAAASAIGGILVERGESIDLVLCSSSRRTRETWDAAAERFGTSPEIRFLSSIYEAGANYLPILRAEGGDAKSLLLIGHNPAIQETALSLASDRSGAGRSGLAPNFPTAALAIFEFDGDWTDLRLGTARLVDFLRPPKPDD